MNNIFNDRNRFVVLIGLIIFLSGLALFAYLGYYNRYWADDWCYNADLNRLGFWGTLKGYTYITTYASNRFSLTLFSGLLFFGDLYGVQSMTLLVIVFLVWGLYRLLGAVTTLFSFELPSPNLLLVTAIIVFYTMYLTPHQYQSLHWRSGLLPYTAPIVFGVWVFALIVSQTVLQATSKKRMILTGMIAFFGGGFSEAGSAVLVSMLAGFVAFSFFYRSRNWAKRYLPTAMIALTASALAMFFVIVSPTTSYRVGLYGSPAPWGEFVRLLAYYTYEYLVLNLRANWMVYLAVWGTLFGIGAISHSRGDKFFPVKTWVVVVLLVGILTLLFTAASFSPSVYIEKGLPAARAQVIAGFIVILGSGLIALITGALFGQKLSPLIFHHSVFILLMLFYSFGVYSVVLTAGKVPLYVDRASVWDARDLKIRQSKDQGIEEVHVRGVDGLPVGGITDFMKTRGSMFWVNRCAAQYYGVKVIFATLP
jgi:hypothetical protein